jgi:hypothetical protein
MRIPRLTPTIPVLVLLTAASATPAPAQHLPIEPGQRVRATTASDTVTGSLMRLDSSALVIAAEGWNTDVEVPRPELQRLEIWACCSATGGLIRGAALGAGVALAAGGILLALPSDSGDGANIGAGIVLLLGVPLGTLVGGLIGTEALAPFRWQDVPLPPRRPDAETGNRPGGSVPIPPDPLSPKALRYQAFR